MNININTYREYSQIKLEIEIFYQNRNNKDSFLLFDENKIFGNYEDKKKYSFIKIKEQFKLFFHFYFDNDKTETNLTNLYNINISKIKVIHIIIDNEMDSLDSLFYDCSRVKKINFIKFPGNKIKSMRSMFQFQSWNIKEINFFKFNTKNVADMSNMFNGARV